MDGIEPSPMQVQALCWIELSELPSYPMGKIDRKIADRLLSDHKTC
jgi:hypothetical protein